MKIRGLWYDGPALEPYRSRLSTRGGRHKGKWVVRGDRRDRRTVFFQDPENGVDWHVLRWNGLPPVGEVPAFSDATVADLLREARARGLSPHSDADLLPVLLDLVGGVIPVQKWPTQVGKSGHTARAREEAKAEAVRTDRSSTPRSPGPSPVAGPAEVVPLVWPQRASQTEDAVDAERRRRREAAVPVRPGPPPLLGEALRRGSLFLLPDDDDEPVERQLVEQDP